MESFWFFTAVILVVEVRPEPVAVVVPTDEAALTVPVMVTVCLALSTGPEHGAALSPRHHRPLTAGSGDNWGCWLLTAVIFRMVILSELETVVTPTHQLALAASVAVVLTPVPRTVTVSLSLPTGQLRSATSPAIVVPPRTPLTWPWLGGDTPDTQDQEQEETKPDAKLNCPVHLIRHFFSSGATNLHSSLKKNVK